MFLKQFYSVCDDKILIDASQASLFAKEIAGDFNPIHDEDSKRFCVPGDLLFSLVLEKYGLSQKMCFTFSGMVGHGVYLNFPDTDAERIDITDDSGKTYMQVTRDGAVETDPSVIETFIRKYVAFSGPNFPHVLVPLMAKQNVMFNPDRPLVIYESMSFELNRLNFTGPELEPAETVMETSGKRGDVRLHFLLKAGNETIGAGFKKLVISGMRAYDHDVIEKFTENYLAHMSEYKSRQLKAGHG
ncbi:MAG: DUF3581 domain-containing protein [Gammaproteobacteria bacterium]